jgi:hypothetical protein
VISASDVEERAVEEAKGVFLAMPVRNSVSWNTMVSGFASAGDMGMVEECASGTDRRR